jgi:hypothetical protein
MKTVLAVIGGLVAVVVITVVMFAMFVDVGKNTTNDKVPEQVSEILIIAEQPDDLTATAEIRSQFTDEYFRRSDKMIDVQFGIGNPNRNNGVC